MPTRHLSLHSRLDESRHPCPRTYPPWNSRNRVRSVDMVDWSLARRIAAFAGATDGSADIGMDVVAASKRLEPEVAGYTGLDPQGNAPPAELVDRAAWADANLTTFSHLLEPIAAPMSVGAPPTRPR